MQEIKAESLLSRSSTWNKLLGRYKSCLPPMRVAAAVREVIPMTVPRLLLTVFLIVYACGYSNAFAAQKHDNKVSGACDSNTDTIAQSTLQQYPEYPAVLAIDRAATRSGPCSLVEHQFTASVCIDGCSVRRDVASRGQRLGISQREASESNGNPIGRFCVAQDQGINFERNQVWALTHSQIQCVINDTILFDKFEPARLEARSFSIPSIHRNVDGGNAGHWLLGRDDLQSADYMGSRNEMTLTVNEEPGSFDDLHDELATFIESPAQDWNNAALGFLNGQNERVTSSTLPTDKKTEKKKSQEGVKSVDESHNSGVLVIANDGKGVGCTTQTSSSTMSISCPQVEASRPAHQQVPQSSKHDSSSPPPSQE